MQVKDWLAAACTQLEAAGIGTARLDALVLLEDLLSKDRAAILAEPEQDLTPAQVAKLKKLLRLRAMHEPLAYIRGKTEFYGREFVISPAVLEPRPESETMIDCLKLAVKSSILHTKNLSNLAIADVGAGSGALGITAKLELEGGNYGVENVAVDLLEIDQNARQVAKMNVDKYTTDIRVTESDLLASGKRQYDILLCNLPYVPDEHIINRAAMHEPKLAIFGGPDGLALYRRLFEQVSKLPKRPLYILTESLPPQHDQLEQIAESSQYQLIRRDDFIQVFGDKHEVA